MSQIEEYVLPFPSRLMSTDKSPATMGAKYAREIVNMYMGQDGSGEKRSGFTQIVDDSSDDKIIKMVEYVTLTGDVQFLAVTAMGKLLKKNESDWIEVVQGFSLSAEVSTVVYGNKLIFANGIDPLKSWDGETLKALEQEVLDPSDSINVVDIKKFTTTADKSFYKIGRKLKLYAGDVVTEAEVENISELGDNLTEVILTADVVPTGLERVTVLMQPPVLRRIYASQDRLWGFGTGNYSSHSFSASAERAVVYFTKAGNKPENWYSDSAGLSYIDLSTKMPVVDELLDISEKDGITLFFFKNTIQLWKGYNPAPEGSFSWLKTLNIGAVHPGLIADLPNDIAFFSDSGARSLSRVLQTEQLDVTDFAKEVDPSITAAVSLLKQNDQTKVASFHFSEQGWYGFKIGAEVFVFQTTGALYGWTKFKGLFSQADSFFNSLNGKLYLSIGRKLYQYTTDIYDDNGLPISTKWWTPWLRLNNNQKRWANKYVSVLSEQGVYMPIQIKRYKDYDSFSYQTTITAQTSAPTYWNTASWDSDPWNGFSAQAAKKEDKFVCNLFSYAVETNSIKGPLKVHGIKIQGIIER